MECVSTCQLRTDFTRKGELRVGSQKFKQKNTYSRFKFSLLAIRTLFTASSEQNGYSASKHDSAALQEMNNKIRSIPLESAIINKVMLTGSVCTEPELVWEDDGTVVTLVWLEIKRWRQEKCDRFLLEIRGKGEEESLSEVVCNNIGIGEQVQVEGKLTVRRDITGNDTAVVKVNELKIAVKQGNAEFPEREEVVSGKKDWSFAGIKGVEMPKSVEDEWRNFFSHPEQYWDNRKNKASPRSPDFRNKETKIGLWINDLKLPSWVPQKLKEFDKEVKNQ